MASPTYLTLAGLAMPAGLLDDSEVSIAHLRPLYAAAGHLTDLAYVRLNPAAQRWLGLPEFPAESLRTLAPHDPALFAFYCQAFASEEACYYRLPGPAGGRVAAQRHGELLVVQRVPATQVPAPEEPQTANAELARAQHTLWQLNQELECRVAAGVAAAQQARAEAEQQRQRLERFFQQAPAAICVLDGPDLVFELVNPNYQRHFPDRQLLGQPLATALPELAQQNIPAILQQVYATGLTHEGHEVRLSVARPGSGPPEESYFNCIYQARYNEQGRIDGVLVFALDVTAQVEAQQQADALRTQVAAAAQRQVQEREAFYQIFAQTPAIVGLMRGPTHCLDYANQAFQQLFPDRELLHRTLAEALPEAVPLGFIQVLDHVYQTGEPFVGNEIPLVTNSATQPQFLNLTYQAYRENGAIAGVSVFGYEVTEQVLARRQREADLGQLQTIFEQAPVALALLQGPAYVVEVANPAICELWGRERTQVMGRPLFEVLPELVAQGSRQRMDEVRRTGVPFVTDEHPAYLDRYGQRETRYYGFVYQPIMDQQGQVAAVVVVASDVSARLAARQQLAQANAELHVANGQLTRTNVDLDNFIYTASHDLKAPIANIESLLRLLRQQLPAEARQEGLVPRILPMMQGAIERFQLTISQLTDLAHLQQAHRQPPESMDLAAAIEAVRLDLLPQLEAAGGELRLHLACPTVALAPQQLRSVLYNLLSNALKYAAPGRAPLVQLRCYAQAAATVLEVEDNGLGLSPAQQGGLFGLFRRLHAHVPGSGVGLYMVKRIVENAGGTVAVRSELGVGTTFILSLPY